MWIPARARVPPFSTHAAPGDELPAGAKRIAESVRTGISAGLRRPTRRPSPSPDHGGRGRACRRTPSHPGAAQAAGRCGGGAEAVKGQGPARGSSARARARYPMIPAHSRGRPRRRRRHRDLVGERFRYDHALREAAVPVVPRERRGLAKVLFPGGAESARSARAGEPRDSDPFPTGKRPAPSRAPRRFPPPGGRG